MKLITKPIAKILVDHDAEFLASNDGKTSDDIAVKLFTPWANATWYIVSGTPLDAINGEPTTLENAKDWHLWGWCDLGLGSHCAELGYVLLSELLSIRHWSGLMVERDKFYSGKLSEVMGEYRRAA